MPSNIITEGNDKLNLDDGYFTRNVFLNDSKACVLYEDTITQLVKDTKKVIGDRTWYLTTIALPAGILFPDGTVDKYDWVVAPIADIDSDESAQYPVPGKSGEYYRTRVGIENAKKFIQFKEGLVYLGML
tara:strand:- start:20973 stop:21362 length:390 start_codon:yes stop_codon:yes gene_type:complete